VNTKILILIGVILSILLIILDSVFLLSKKNVTIIATVISAGEGYVICNTTTNEAYWIEGDYDTSKGDNIQFVIASEEKYTNPLRIKTKDFKIIEKGNEVNS